MKLLSRLTTTSICRRRSSCRCIPALIHLFEGKHLVWPMAIEVDLLLGQSRHPTGNAGCSQDYILNKHILRMYGSEVSVGQLFPPNGKDLKFPVTSTSSMHSMSDVRKWDVETGLEYTFY